MFTIHMHNTYIYLHFKHCFATKWSQSIWWNAPGISGLLLECPLIRDGGDGVLQRFEVYLKTQVFGFYVVLCLFRWYCTEREGVQRRHDPRKNDLRVSGFAELPPGPAKLVSQPPWRHQASHHSVSTPRILDPIKNIWLLFPPRTFFFKFSTWWNSSKWYINICIKKLKMTIL